MEIGFALLHRLCNIDLSMDLLDLFAMIFSGRSRNQHNNNKINRDYIFPGRHDSFIAVCAFEIVKKIMKTNIDPRRK